MDFEHEGPETGTEKKAPASLERADALIQDGVLTRVALEGVQARDSHALATFFEFYFDRVYGLAYRLLGDRTSAEDVTQEVFQKVYKAASQLDPTRDPGPWLTTITHNACRDFWRSKAFRLGRRSQSLEDTEGLAEVLPAPGESPEEALLREERARQVQAAILKLPEDLRSVVILHDYQGLGHEDIAAMIGTTHAATRKRYSRAMSRLAMLLRNV